MTTSPLPALQPAGGTPEASAAIQAALLDALPIPAALIDAQGCIRSLNPPWRDTAADGGSITRGTDFGRSCLTAFDEVVGDGQEPARRIAEGIRSVLGGAAASFSLEYATGSDRPPGERRWYRMTVTQLPTGAGAVISHQNIGRRKPADELHRSESELVRTLIDALPDVVYTLDREGCFSLCNPAAAAVCGAATAEDLLGRSALEVFGPGAGENVRADDLRVLSGQDVWNREERAIGPGGETRWYLTTKLPLRNATGRIEGLIAISRNITELKVAQDETRQALARLVEAKSIAKLGSWSIDLATMTTHWSERIYSIFELDPDEPSAPQPFGMERVHPEDRAAVEQAFRRSLEQHTSEFIEHRLVLPSGAVKVVEERWRVAVDEAGQATQLVGTCQDITERRAVEEELRRGQAQLRMAGRLAKVGAWSVDLSQDHVVWSDEVCSIHEEPLGTRPTLEEAIAYFPGAWAEVVRNGFVTCARDGTPYDLELEIITAKGRRIWVRAIGEAVRDEGGVIRGVQGAFQDISDRKLAELETHRLATRLRSTLESISVPFYTVDRDWRITYVNPAAERMAGRKGADLIGHDLWQHFPQLADTAIEQAYRSALEENRILELDAYVPAWERWFHVNVYPSEEGLAVYKRDITSERATSQELGLLQAGVARLSDIVLVTEAFPVDEPGPRIRFVNDAFERITGYTRAEALGQSPRMLQGPLTDRAELDRIRAALERFEPVQAELLNYTKSGETYWVKIDVMPVGTEATGGRYFVCIQHDITHRKRNEQALTRLNLDLEARVQARTAELAQARDEANRANMAKSVFLATMSHEIRTPLNGVVGMIEVLQQTGLQSRQLEMVELIRDSSDSLLGIIEDILDFTKIEAGKMSLRPGPLRLGGLVDKVCAMLGPVAGRGQVRLTNFVDPAIPPLLIADEIRLRQVLVNLVGNAIKFSGGGDLPGEASVSAVLTSRTAEAASIELTVTDNGVGMDEAALERLFDPFWQADESITRRFGGTGLGLAITEKLVRLMGGRVAVRSQPGEGAAFSVCLALPIAAADPEGSGKSAPASGAAGVQRAATGEGVAVGRAHRDAAGAAAPPDDDSAPPRVVLVAEDNETNRRVIGQQLALLGFAAEVVADGRQALDRWRHGDYALLLTDLHMPGLDGYALTAAIRAEEGARQRMPIIAVTANALLEEELRCRAAGMDGYLTKPITLQRLGAVLGQWLELRTASPASPEPPPAAAAQAPVVDLSVIHAIVGDDPDVLAEILQVFRDSAVQSSREMHGFAAESRIQAVADVAHRMKSGARSIGAQRLADTCAEIEDAKYHAQTAPLGALLQRFDTELAEVMDIVDAHLADLQRGQGPRPDHPA